MPPVKTPTSSLPGIRAPHFSSAYLTMITGAVVKRAWCHSLARIRRMCSAIVSHETRQSSARILPLEIVEIIIAQLIYDIQSLRACSLTCYSWYIVAVPHLHYTFIAPIRYNRREDPKFGWSGPLPNMHKLGLLPLVKKFQICRTAINDFQVFSPKRFNRRILYHFTALTNVQDLRIDYLDIASFMPKIQPYFGHFLPSVRSLALESTQRIPPADHILHRIVPIPGRSQAYL